MYRGIMSRSIAKSYLSIIFVTDLPEAKYPGAGKEVLGKYTKHVLAALVNIQERIK
jgi:hypothetical protein